MHISVLSPVCSVVERDLFPIGQPRSSGVDATS